MARTRYIKPGFFQNDKLAELGPWHRLLFAGLWTLADSAGRMEDRPKRIKGQLFPFDDVDVDAMLNDLHRQREVCKGMDRRCTVAEGHTMANVWREVKR
jgi:hypothetical protein